MTTPTTDALAAALEKLDSRLAMLGGCSDGGCLVVRPKGMHTNGGCKCLDRHNPIRTQHFARIYNEFASECRAALAAA